MANRKNAKAILSILIGVASAMALRVSKLVIQESP